MIRNIKYLKALMVAYGAMLFEGGANVIIISTMTFLSMKYKVELADISLLLVIKSTSTAIILYVAGNISDKIGRKNVIATGTVLLMFFFVGLYFSENYMLAILFSIIGGLGQGMMDSPAMSIIFDAIDENTGPAMSLIQFFFTGGGALITFITSVLIRNNINFAYLYIGYVSIGLILLFIVITAIYPAISNDKNTKSKTISFEIEPSFKREGVFVIFLTYCSSSLISIIMTWLPTFAREIKNFVEADSVLLLTSYQIGAIAGALIFAVLLKYVHPTVLIAFNPFILTSMLGVLLSSDNQVLLFAVIAVSGVFMGVYFSMCVNMGGELFSKNPGKIVGAIGTANFLANTIMVSITSRIFKTYGIYNVFIVGFALSIFLLLVGFLFYKNYKRLGVVYDKK